MNLSKANVPCMLKSDNVADGFLPILGHLRGINKMARDEHIMLK